MDCATGNPISTASEPEARRSVALKCAICRSLFWGSPWVSGLYRAMVAPRRRVSCGRGARQGGECEANCSAAPVLGGRTSRRHSDLDATDADANERPDLEQLETDGHAVNATSSFSRRANSSLPHCLMLWTNFPVADIGQWLDMAAPPNPLTGRALLHSVKRPLRALRTVAPDPHFRQGGDPIQRRFFDAPLSAAFWRRSISRSTACRNRSARFSPSSRTASMRASVPAEKRAGICSSFIRLRPTGVVIGDITICFNDRYLISFIDRARNR
jgi:hypothetical protein